MFPIQSAFLFTAYDTFPQKTPFNLFPSSIIFNPPCFLSKNYFAVTSLFSPQIKDMHNLFKWLIVLLSGGKTAKVAENKSFDNTKVFIICVLVLLLEDFHISISELISCSFTSPLCLRHLLLVIIKCNVIILSFLS